MILKYEKYMDKLNGEYLNVCKKVREYALQNSIGGKYLGERMMDFIDLLLEAQKQEIDCEKIIGNDVESFCRTFFQDYGVMDRVRDFLQGLTYCSWMFVLIGLGHINFSDWNHIFQGVSLNLFWSIILGIAIASIIDAVMVFFNLSKVNIKMKYIIKAVIQLICTIVVVMFVLENKLPVFILFLVSGIFLLMYYSTTLVLNYLESGSFTGKSSDYTTWFGEVLKKGWKSEFDRYNQTVLLAEGLVKRYEKINHKRRKKGKAEWDTDTFFGHMKKEWKHFGITLFILLAFIVIGLTFEISGSTGMINTVIFLLICTFVEGLWFLICLKLMKKGLGRYDEIHKRCLETEMSLTEYITLLKKE